MIEGNLRQSKNAYTPYPRPEDREIWGYGPAEKLAHKQGKHWELT